MPQTLLRNVPAAVNPNHTASTRPVYCEPFADGSGLVFNAENPSGVKYLEKEAFAAYRSLVAQGHPVPRVHPAHSPLHAALVQHGIAESTESSPQPAPQIHKNRRFTVWFHISNACNLSCSYCYLPRLEKAVDLASMSRHFMSHETIDAATRSLFQFCVENHFSALEIKFAGGEPTLDVERINTACDRSLALASSTGVKIAFAILTNAVFVDPSIFKTLTKYRFSVAISMDGPRERHNDSRFTILRSRPAHDPTQTPEVQPQRLGSWDAIDHNIGQMLSLGIKPFILCTVTGKNYRDLLGLAQYTISRRIGFRLSLVRDKHTYKTGSLPEDLLAELAGLYDWLGRNMPAAMPIERFARFADWQLDSKKLSVCGTCKSMIAIDQEGRAASCQMTLDRPHGSVHEQTLSSLFVQIATAQDNTFLANPQAKTGDCSVCYWKYTCAGGCPEHTRSAVGTANSPSPWCQIYQDFLPHYLRAIATQTKNRLELASATPQ